MRSSIISGNAIGVALSGTGTDHTGTAAIPNVFVGVSITASSNAIGGTVLGARNLISGNNGSSQTGIDIEGVCNVVVGNFIGTDVTGTRALGNELGVEILASNNQVGGTAAAERNIISGNQGGSVLGGGIYVYGVGGSVIQGNYIGIDVNGTLPLAVPVGQQITATATDANNNTSEFSGCQPVTPS